MKTNEQIKLFTRQIHQTLEAYYKEGKAPENQQCDQWETQLGEMGESNPRALVMAAMFLVCGHDSNHPMMARLVERAPVGAGIRTIQG